MQYIYSFVVWPDETRGFDPAVYKYFRVFRRRTEMHLTENEFAEFRKGMENEGFTLRECTRVLYINPEPIL